MKIVTTIDIPDKYTITPDIAGRPITYTYEAIGEDMPHGFIVTEYYRKHPARSWFITRQEYIDTYRMHVLGIEP